MSSITKFYNDEAKKNHIEQFIQGLYVIKRNGRFAPVKYDKITERISKLTYGLDREYVDPAVVSQKVCMGVYRGVTTRELDELAAETSAHLVSLHPDFGTLAARIAVSNLHKSTLKSFSETAKLLYNYIEPRTKQWAPMLSDHAFEFIQRHADELDSAINYDRDFQYDYFGFKTLCHSYLFKVNGKIVECPQHMLMRVAIGIHLPDPIKPEKVEQIIQERVQQLILQRTVNYINAVQSGNTELASTLESTSTEKQEIELKVRAEYKLEEEAKHKRVLEEVLEYYEYMSLKWFTPATPTLFNAATRTPQLSSCVLLQIPEDSIESIYETLKQTALISKSAAGIGIAIHKIRAAGSHIKGTNGTSNGIVPMLRNFNTTARYVDQGGGKRKGAFACYLEPFHADIFSFLDLKKNNGVEEERARDLFYGMWIPNLFMERVAKNENWTLFSPDETPELPNTFGDKYEEIYRNYELIKPAEHKRVIPARKLWEAILTAQIETGTPYMLYKDSANAKSNQKNLGTIHCSNLCVRGNTCILTDKGQFEIASIVDTTVNVWNGEEFTETVVRKTGINQKLKSIEFSNGVTIECTPYHKFYDNLGKEIRAADLSIGTKLEKVQKWPVIDGTEAIKYPYTHGLYCSEGFEADHTSEVLPSDIDLKFKVPINASITDKLRWFEGYCDGDGCVSTNGDNYSIQCSSRNKEFLLQVRLMLQTLGIDTEITKMCDTNGRYLLLLSSNSLASLINIGFYYPKRLNFDAIGAPNRDAHHFTQVSKISDVDGLHDTFCFTEKKLNKGIFNGIRTGNCTEIIEYTSKDEVANCLTADSLIMTKSGIRKIIDCDDADVFVPFESDNALNSKPHFEKAVLVNKGEQEIYQIDCISSNSIKATAAHKFLTFQSRNYHTKINTYEWKRVDQLKTGDRLAISLHGPVSNEFDITLTLENLNKDFASIGWVVGDGWFTKSSNQIENSWVIGVCFGPEDVYASEIVLSVLNRWQQTTACALGGHDNLVNVHVQPNGVINWACSKKAFVALITTRFGLKPALSPKKEIPEAILNSNPTELASFLSALFSADGCVIMAKDKGPLISYSSASKKLLDQIQLVMTSFGIHGKVYWQQNVLNRGTNQGTYQIFGKENLLKYHKSIGFLLSLKKQSKLNEYLKFEYTQASHNHEWVSVKQIVPIGKEQVYDLAMVSGHHFIANGKISHNCNLHSIALPMFMNADKTFNYAKLFNVTKLVTRGLNKVIDINAYSVPQARHSNLKHRPIGIGVQGLADLFVMMRLPYDSPEAQTLNKNIFETIYFAALTASNELAQELGHYESMKQPHPETKEIAPIANGIFQFELHYQYQEMMYAKYAGLGIPKPNKAEIYPSSGLWNWEALRAKIIQFGVRNSLVVAPMPTASTSQILNNTESFEPLTSNIYVRRTLAGEFVCVSRHLVRDLIELGLWNQSMKNKLVAHNGSVQKIEEIPNNLKAIYRTVWEISQKSVIDMAATRGAFIDQSQSLNIHMQNPNFGNLGAMHFYGWARGLKTGMYYLRSKPAVDAIKFTIDPALIKEQQEQTRVEKALRPNPEKAMTTSGRNLSGARIEMLEATTVPTIDLTNAEEIQRQRDAMTCSLDNPENCLLCSS